MAIKKICICVLLILLRPVVSNGGEPFLYDGEWLLTHIRCIDTSGNVISQRPANTTKGDRMLLKLKFPKFSELREVGDCDIDVSGTIKILQVSKKAKETKVQWVADLSTAKHCKNYAPSRGYKSSSVAILGLKSGKLVERDLSFGECQGSGTFLDRFYESQ